MTSCRAIFDPTLSFLSATGFLSFQGFFLLDKWSKQPVATDATSGNGRRFEYSRLTELGLDFYRTLSVFGNAFTRKSIWERRHSLERESMWLFSMRKGRAG